MSDNDTKRPEVDGPGLVPTRGQKGAEQPPLVNDPEVGDDAKEGAPDPKRTEKKVIAR